MICSQCGHNNKDASKFCEKCGTKLSPAFCSECGHENSAGAQFCQDCGASLQASAPAATQPNAAPLTPAGGVSAGMSAGGIILLSLAGLLVVAGGAVYLFRDALGISFFGGSNPDPEQVAPASEAARITYSTNPAPIVDVGKPVELVYDWNASTIELVQEFIDNSEQQVKVNGELVTAKVTYSEIIADALNGGYKTQIMTDVGQLPVGKSAIDTTISFKKPVSNGSETFGPGTQKEHVEKHGKVVVNDPANPQASSVDHSADNCPPPEDVMAEGLLWDGDTPVLIVKNTQGWEPYQEDVGNPAIFSQSKYPWAHPVCEVDSDDSTYLYCAGEFDEPALNKDEIGVYLPYPWSESRTGWCTFEENNLEQIEIPCPPEEDIFPGEVYWEEGIALIDIENPDGWEPYVEQEGYPSILAVNDEPYTDLTCEVHTDDSTMMTCGGPGTIKTGGMGMLLNFPSNGTYCQLVYNEIGIKDICNVGYKFCVYAGACCPESYTCDVQGCHRQQSHDDHDDHDDYD